MRPRLDDSHASRRVDLEGLRGLAVLAIVAFDCKAPFAQGGFAGIDIFFVLSGYLVCRAAERRLTAGTFSVARFYLERLRRILPVLYVVLLFCLVLGALVLSPWEAYRLGQGVVAAALSGSNFLYLIRGSFFAERAIMNPLLMTWPIALAMQYYAVLPALLLPLRRSKPRVPVLLLSLVTAASFAACTYLESRQHIWNFYLPVTRAWELGAGSLLALLWVRETGSRPASKWMIEATGAAGLLMMAGTILLFNPAMRWPGYDTLVPVAGALLTIVSGGSLANRLLAARPLAILGAVAYPLYLWQWPLLSFAAICSARALEPATIAVVLGLAAVAAIITYVLVERRFRAGQSLRPLGGVLRFASASAVLALLGGIFFVTRGLPARSPVLYGIETRAALYRHYPCISPGSYLRLSASCAPLPRRSTPALAVLGGGHAEALAEGLRDYAEKGGWQLITLTRESCPPTRGFSQWSPTDSTLQESCRQFNRAALTYLLARPDLKSVVLVGRWRAGLAPDGFVGDPAKRTETENDEDLRQGLGNEIAALQGAGKQVIVVEDTPEFPYDPVAAIRARYLPLRRLLNRILLAQPPEQGDGSSDRRTIAVSAAEEHANQQVLAVAQKYPGVTLIDPRLALCTSDRCSFASGDDVFFFDSIHLSRTGALQVAALFPSAESLKQP